MKVITTRIEDEYFEDLKKIGQEEHTKKADVIRKLLAEAIKEWKMEKALEALKEHRMTLRRAAAFAGVPYIKILDMASKSDIDGGYALNDLKDDMSK